MTWFKQPKPKMAKRTFWLVKNLSQGPEVAADRGYDASADEEDREMVLESEANVVSSWLANGMHAPAIDIDGIEVRVLPSSTPGNYHLYIDKAMTWEVYRRLLYALEAAGIIERGYLLASIAKGQTFLRKPGVTK